MNSSTESIESGIRLHDLTVTAGERILLQGVNIEFPARQISIVVGPSGVGKSVMLKIVAGLISKRYDGISVAGSVELNGRPVQCGQAGVVFQDFALLDELSPAGNVEFATLSNPKTKSKRSAEDWLNELHVPLNVPTSRLSGGQRQRLAIARTLAANPQVILYDEPTSGLDPSTGDRVAKLIRDTHDQYQKTSIVVTHDYPTVLPIADRVFLFDAAALQIVEVPRDEWPELAQRLNRAAQSRESSPLELSKEPWSQRWVRWGAHFFSKTTDSALAGLQGLVSILPLWRNPKWGFRFLLHYANLVTGPTAMLYLFMAGMINGFVSTYFTFQFFPFATYTEPLLIEDLLQAIGFILYRVFVPILACILIAARCGAAVTADVGGRQYGSQLDAMLTFNAPPRQYLLTPIMLSFLIGTPLLNFVSYFGAVTASLFSFVWSHPDRGPDFWSHHFYWKLEAYNSWIFYGFPWLVSKLLCSAVGIGCIAYFQGRSPKYSTSDVSRSVTNTILWGTLYVLAVHFAFALYEFESLRPQRIVE